MVISRYYFCIVAGLLSTGCEQDATHACERFPAVCAELNNHQPITVIVTVSFTADKPTLKSWLEDEDISIVSEFKATDQWLVELTMSEFIALSEQPGVENISIDKFYPR
ncbi:hypothetical protein [Alteromonas sp. C1M14]|uniref:hypothetical protein n=1 Tax=Alteromonas sp. C1M14 TaxID=2841567 RepID=UPI001C08BA6F|nr:hypothetical protein [Alteromonas sp. C1M14]MBU2978219.1 hypothetical protein [Alteromonas sp. C1M14]